jgi:RecA/RadA recombinase
MPGRGVAVLEVKGGQVWREDGAWWMYRAGRPHPIDPVTQARDARYALGGYLDRQLADQGIQVRTVHGIVLPQQPIGEDVTSPDCPRWMIAGRDDMGRLLEFVAGLFDQQRSPRPPLTDVQAQAVIAAILGRPVPRRDVQAQAAAHDDEIRRLSSGQALLLGAISLLNRVEIVGGAGCGKTFLALEQTRRLASAGARVALLCYNRGLARQLAADAARFPPSARPAYVGTFHGLAERWSIPVDDGATGDYWERDLPAAMLPAAQALADDKRFDAIVVDEAQDFADLWWPVVLASLVDDAYSGLYVFADRGQRIFARDGAVPVPLVPLLLEQNLRNTREIAQTFAPLVAGRLSLPDDSGADVTFIDVPADQAVDAADDAVDALLDEGWRPGDIALLTTDHRHLMQRLLTEQLGRDGYWDRYDDPDEVFYSTVRAFKGLERRAVVLAIDAIDDEPGLRERLYVGLSRARDRLIVCGPHAAFDGAMRRTSRPG